MIFKEKLAMKAIYTTLHTIEIVKAIYHER